MALTDTVVHNTMTISPSRPSIDGALCIKRGREDGVAHCIPGKELLLLAKVAANVMQQWMIKNDQ